MNVQLLQQTRNHITMAVLTRIEDVEIRDGLQGLIVSLEGGKPSGEIGGPDLPQITFEVALPPGTTLGKVNVEPKGELIVVRKQAILRPVQPPAPGSCRPSDPRLGDDGLVRPWPTPHPIPPDPELYRRAYTEERPAAYAVSVDHQGPNGIARLVARPLSLREDGALVLQTQLEILVTLVALNEDDKARQRQIRFHSRQQALRWTELAASHVINASDIVRFGDYLGALSHADYLIITSNQIWDAIAIAPAGEGIGDAVSEFERLASWKRKKGLSARVVTVDDIVAGKYGTFTGACRRDLQEVLREFIKWAYREWGVTWILLGGDADIIPVRKVVGYAGGIAPGTKDPPDDGGSFWTGSALKLHTKASIDDIIRTSDGRRLRYSDSGTGSIPRWSYTDETYTKISLISTEYVRIDGSASDLQAEELFVLNNDNAIPTDLYYATVAGYGATGGNPLYFCDARTGATGSRCATRDWDWQDNGLYGQYNNDGDLGGQTYTPDISVGRAPISSAGEAKAFVDKVISYENAGPFSGQWIRKLLLVSSNWGGRVSVGPGFPLTDNTYLHETGADHTVIQLSAIPTGAQTKLIAVAADGTELPLPFHVDAAPGQPGWTYVRSATDTTASLIDIWVPWQLIQIPFPTFWIAVYGAANLEPAAYVVDDAVADGSMMDQETLRHQLANAVPGWSDVDRIYEDDLDLDPPDRAGAPLAHLTQSALEARLDAGPHIVSLSGHGNWPGCCGLDPGLNDRLTNAGAPFIGYADSCLTNEFDLTYAISEDLVTNTNGGAVAYIGNSRFSWIGVGDDFQRNFFDGLPTTTAIGLLHDRRCAGVHLVPGYERYNRWSIFSLNLMGDPEMHLRVHALRFPCIELAAAARLDQPYNVRVLQDSSPVSRAVVTASSGEWQTQAITSHDGSATLDLTGAPMGDLSITVTHPDLLPATGKSRVIGPIWREAEIQRVDASQAGIQALVRWDNVEHIVHLSPCGTASLLPVLTTAIATARPIRLYVVEEAGGPIVEAASLI